MLERIRVLDREKKETRSYIKNEGTNGGIPDLVPSWVAMLIVSKPEV
jgi:hypothetical protein